MPPVRRGRTREINEGSSSQNTTDNVANLRQQCAEKGLPTNGRRNVLIARLQQHAAANANLPSTSSESRPVIPETQPALTESQLAQIQGLIVSRSVEQSVAEIATNAARAAVQAMSNSTPRVPSIPIVVDEVESTANASLETVATNTVGSNQAANIVPYGNGFHEVPASYVRQIQTGEFFDLSKLLPRNMSFSNTSEEPIILTLENSVIKAKKASQPTARITEIEQWTTAFTVYMSVMTHQYPGRAQELLQYMSLIRHAAQTHRGLGWCIYDHKFRCKAALNPSMTWSMIDQQLWLMIFTTSPDMLVQHYPIFSNRPQNRASSGGERGGYCHDYNRWGYCTREPCRYRHVCNKCSNPHPGSKCSLLKSKPADDEEPTSKRGSKSSKSKRE
ncbi:gag [Paramuricea clavata]|uniref:TPA_exp: gag n=1 Tax=Paramuricea clavata TaxID=317549 RepID=A0A6S7FTI5_PARCT|nr:gag [Paramuricea clavata]